MKKKQIRVGIIHAYPNTYLIESLQKLGCNLVLFVSQSPIFSYSNLEAVIEVPLHRPSMVIEKVKDFHQHKPFDVLLPIYEGATTIIAKASEVLGLPGVSFNGAQASRNKYLAYQKWSQRGIPVPLTIPIRNPYEGCYEIENSIGYPAIIKLADSMNSQGVIKVASKQEYFDAVRYLLNMLEKPVDSNLQTDRNRLAYGNSEIKIIAQEYCSGIEVGVDCIVSQNRCQILGIFEKASAKGPYFAEEMSISPCSLGKKELEQVNKIASDAALALTAEQSSAAHVEIRFTSSGPKVLEAGLRPGGAYTVAAIEYLSKINLYVELLNVLLGEDPKVIQHNGKAVLYGGIVIPKSGILTSIKGLHIFDSISEVLDFQILNQLGEKVYCLPESAQPHFAYYLVGGSSRNEVLNKHRLIQQSICLEISNFCSEDKTMELAT